MQLLIREKEDRNNSFFFGTTQSKHQEAFVGNHPNQIQIQCQEAPKNRSIHIVVGSYKYQELEAGVSFESNNYLWDMGLTNTRIFWYRKTHPEFPRRLLHGPCNVTIEERVFLPNYGQEAVAFLNHIIEVYNNPPEAIMFLHGHLGRAWHATCENTFSKMIGYYKYSMHTMNTTLDAVLDLTDINNLQNIGKKRKRQGSSRILRRSRSKETQPCDAFLDDTFAKYNMTDPRESYDWFPCCSNGIFPWTRIQRYPVEFYQDWLQFMSNTYHDQHMTTRFCFEYIIFPLYVSRKEMVNHYQELVQGGWIQQYHGNATLLSSCTELNEVFGLKKNITLD